jgi:hypothetical protein
MAIESSNRPAPRRWLTIARSKQNETVIKLEGSKAGRGIGLFDLESFIDEFLRGLRAFDRSRRLEPALRAGHPTKRDELVTAFRLVELKAGSAILTLEPAPIDETDAEMFPDAAALAVANLDSLLDALNSDEPVDPDVADALTKARRALGPDGRISVKRAKRRVVLDEVKERKVAERARRVGAARKVSISGRLHAIDLEPERVGIRATDGVDWVCRYPPELEADVTRLLGATVWARGIGQLTGAQRGSLDIKDLQSVGPFEQSELFTFERVPLHDLLEAQGIAGPTGPEAFDLPGDLTDDQVDAYVADVLGESGPRRRA